MVVSVSKTMDQQGLGMLLIWEIFPNSWLIHNFLKFAVRYEFTNSTEEFHNGRHITKVYHNIFQFSLSLSPCMYVWVFLSIDNKCRKKREIKYSVIDL